MVFIEASAFTKYVYDYLYDDEYGNLQKFLIEQPDGGDIISGTGGLRKVRWKVEGKGKRGGVRLIYYWHPLDGQIFLLSIYAKNDMSDLSIRERKALKQLVERWLS